MNHTRHLLLGLMISATSMAASAQDFNQRGPTGDNRAATGHPAVQASPMQNAREMSQQQPARKQSPSVAADANRDGQAKTSPHATNATNATNASAEHDNEGTGAQ